MPKSQKQIRMALNSAGIAVAMAASVLVAAQAASASTFTSVTAGGDWTTPATWTANSSSPGATAAGDIAQINSGTVTLNSALPNDLETFYIAAGGTLTLGSSSSITTANASNAVKIGNGGTGTATLNINGGTQTFEGAGNYSLWVGASTTAAGVVNQSGGTVTLTKSFLGAQTTDTLANTYTITGGTLTFNGAYRGGNNGTFTLDVAGGTVTLSSTMDVAQGGAGTLTIGSGLVTETDTNIVVSSGLGNGTVNLNGGTLDTVGLGLGSTSSSTVNFNGGTLQAYTGNTNFLTGVTTANVQAGGAVFDSNGHAITAAQNLISDPTTPDGTDGGLTLNDSSSGHNGELILSGTGNTYNGNTTVNDGTLEIETAFLATTSTVSIASGAKMDLAYSGTNDIASIILGGNTLGTGVYGYGLDDGDYNNFFVNDAKGGTLTVIAAVPAPATLGLVLIGGLGLLLIGRKRAKKAIM